MAPILASKWRKEVLDLSQLPVQTAFLELQGPVFTPGRPLPLFNESRRVIWERSYPASLVMTEMLIWLNEIEYTKSRCGLCILIGIVIIIVTNYTMLCNNDNI
jgi:hypothetical protein